MTTRIRIFFYLSSALCIAVSGCNFSSISGTNEATTSVGTASSDSTPTSTLGSTSAVVSHDPTFRSLAPVPVSDSCQTGTLYEDRLYVFGMCVDGGAQKSAYAYDFQDDEWKPLSLPGVARAGGATAAANGKIYVIGGLVNGSTSNSVEEYDPTSDSWMPKGSAPVALLDNPNAVSIGDQIYVTAHFYDRSGTGVYRYDPGSNSWTTLSPYLDDTRSGGGLAVYNSKLYLYGGNFHISEHINELLEYDPASDTWRILSQGPSLRDLPVVSVVGSKMYVFGGVTEASPELYIDTKTDVYDFETGEWSKSLDSPTGVVGAVSGVRDDKIYFTVEKDGTSSGVKAFFEFTP